MDKWQLSHQKFSNLPGDQLILQKCIDLEHIPPKFQIKQQRTPIFRIEIGASLRLDLLNIVGLSVKDHPRAVKLITSFIIPDLSEVFIYVRYATRKEGRALHSFVAEFFELLGECPERQK